MHNDSASSFEVDGSGLIPLVATKKKENTMSNWTDEKLEQFKNLLKNIPSEDAALVTARIWCKEFKLKFDDTDDLIARRWHRFFHTGSLSKHNEKYFIQVKDDHGNWMYVKQMSTKGNAIWTCLYKENTFMDSFKEGHISNWKMAKSYVDALASKGYVARLVVD